MEIWNAIMKTSEEIIVLLNYLEAERERAIANNVIFQALSLASLIQLLKWVLEKQ